MIIKRSKNLLAYFEFLALQEREQNGFFTLTLKFDRSKIVSEGFWEDGRMIGVSKDYHAWDYILDDDASDITPHLYESNPLTQIGFYNKEGLTEGEFIDFHYE
jgi:hypothetical protein